MIRVLHPANWSARGWLIVTLGLGLIGLTGCAPAPTFDDALRECAAILAPRVGDGAMQVCVDFSENKDRSEFIENFTNPAKRQWLAKELAR